MIGDAFFLLFLKIWSIFVCSKYSWKGFATLIHFKSSLLFLTRLRFSKPLWEHTSDIMYFWYFKITKIIYNLFIQYWKEFISTILCSKFSIIKFETIIFVFIVSIYHFKLHFFRFIIKKNISKMAPPRGSGVRVKKPARPFFAGFIQGINSYKVICWTKD